MARRDPSTGTVDVPPSTVARRGGRCFPAPPSVARVKERGGRPADGRHARDEVQAAAQGRLAALGARGRLLPAGEDAGGASDPPAGEGPGPGAVGTGEPWPGVSGAGVPGPGHIGGREAAPSGQGPVGASWAGTFRERVADRVPVSLRGLPGAVPSRAAAAAVAVALAVVAGMLVRGVGAASHGTTVPRGGAATTGSVSWSAPATATSGAAATVQGVLVVDVTGRVRRPGVVRLAAGARVVDAVEAAGGATAGAVLQRINLARPVTDGEQIMVPGPDDPLPTAGGGASPTGSAGGDLVDLNSAGEEELEELPGIGPVLAGRIVQWRTTHGRFTSVDELGEVDGIGEKVLARLRPLVRV